MKPGLVMHLFAFEASVEVGFDYVPERGPTPDVFRGGADDFLAGFVMSLAVGVVGGFVAVIRTDEREKLARGVDDRLVAFPHLLRRFAPRNLVTQLAVGGGQFRGALFQRLVE